MGQVLTPSQPSGPWRQVWQACTTWAAARGLSNRRSRHLQGRHEQTSGDLQPQWLRAAMRSLRLHLHRTMPRSFLRPIEARGPWQQYCCTASAATVLWLHGPAVGMLWLRNSPCSCATASKSSSVGIKKEARLQCAALVFGLAAEARDQSCRLREPDDDSSCVSLSQPLEAMG